jgi:hypothetical protein
VTKLFADATNFKVAALRVRDDNPCDGLPGPDRGERKAKQWLYPIEVQALLACEDVPIRWRRLYALGTYLYLRPGELGGPRRHKRSSPPGCETAAAFLFALLLTD